MLLVFSLRRVAFMFAAWWPPKPVGPPLDEPLPSTTLLIPARNEAAGISATLAALTAREQQDEKQKARQRDDMRAYRS